MNASKQDEELSTSVFNVRTDVSSEDVLVNASEMLASASIMANEQAFGSTGSRRLQIFGLAHLIENAQLLADDALEKVRPTTADQ